MSFSLYIKSEETYFVNVVKIDLFRFLRGKLMKIKNHLLVIGAAALLAAPFALALKPAQPLKTHAATDRIMQIEYEPSRTTSTSIYNYIGCLSFGFKFTYEGNQVDAFPNMGSGGDYIEGHPNINTDEAGNPIHINDGIFLNGKSLSYWASYDVNNNLGIVYPDSTGVHQFPMDLASSGLFIHSPVCCYLKTYRIEFRVNLAIFAMDDITVTFDKDLFYGYNSGYNYKLAETTTFYSSINTDCAPDADPAAKLTFNTSRNDFIAKYQITKIHTSSERTNDGGYPYHYYQLYTNIKIDSSRFTCAVPSDHDRYIYGNIMLNGKPLTYYNAHARANAWDFTDLANRVQNPKYETGHATGSVNPKYDLACRCDLALNQGIYIIAVWISNQCLSDFGIAQPEFALRDGSSWLSLDDNDNSIIARHSPSAFNNYIVAAVESLENYVDLTLYSEQDIAAISDIIYEATANIAIAKTFDEIDALVAAAKAEIDQFSPESEYIEEAKTFVAGFKSAMATACSSANKQSAVEAAWSAQAIIYVSLSEGAKNVTDVGTESSVEEIVEFAERYIAIKQQHGNWTLADFLGWNVQPNPSFHEISVNNTANRGTTILVVSIIASVSAAALIVLVVLRKRRAK